MADAGKIVITPKGKYNSTTTYEWLDEVTYDGKAYIALKTVTGVTPSDDGVNWRLFLDPNDIVAGNLVPTFTEASTRSNIVSGENLSTMFGKIKKWFTDLKSHAFKDLVNNLTTETTGSALDASQGKVLKEEVDETNSNLDDYGLVNQFDGLLQNGDYKSIDGSLIPSQVKVCTVTKIPVKKGDAVTPKAENVNLYYAQAWNTRGEHIGDITSTWINVGTPIKIQDDGYVTFTFKLADSGNITPQTAGKISIYINNAIDELKNDLSSLGCEIAFGDVDFNNLTNKMVYAINGTCTNAPKTTTPIHGILIVFKASNYIISQLYHDSEGTLYNRMCWGGTWGSWK